MMLLGICIETDEDGNVIKEKVIIIEDGATTCVKEERHYDFGWRVVDR